jgi:hypothetical protein
LDYGDQAICFACSSNCGKCTDSTHCTTCSLGYYLVNSANPYC